MDCRRSNFDLSLFSQNTEGPLYTTTWSPTQRKAQSRVPLWEKFLTYGFDPYPFFLTF
jgi:hypothetical protein